MYCLWKTRGSRTNSSRSVMGEIFSFPTTPPLAFHSLFLFIYLIVYTLFSTSSQRPSSKHPNIVYKDPLSLWFTQSTVPTQLVALAVNMFKFLVSTRIHPVFLVYVVTRRRSVSFFCEYLLLRIENIRTSSAVIYFLTFGHFPPNRIIHFCCEIISEEKMTWENYFILWAIVKNSSFFSRIFLLFFVILFLLIILLTISTNFEVFCVAWSLEDSNFLFFFFSDCPLCLGSLCLRRCSW